MAGEGVYVDTSVLGAYYCPEALSAVAEAAIRKLSTPTISLLSEVEFCSLIAKKYRLKELTAGKVKQILDLFASHVADGFYRRVMIGTQHFVEARSLMTSMRSSLRTLDALHLAVAMSEGLGLMTADLDLARAGKKHGVRTSLIRSR